MNALGAHFRKLARRRSHGWWTGKTLGYGHPFFGCVTGDNKICIFVVTPLGDDQAKSFGAALDNISRLFRPPGP